MNAHVKAVALKGSITRCTSCGDNGMKMGIVELDCLLPLLPSPANAPRFDQREARSEDMVWRRVGFTMTHRSTRQTIMIEHVFPEFDGMPHFYTLAIGENGAMEIDCPCAPTMEIIAPPNPTLSGVYLFTHGLLEVPPEYRAETGPGPFVA